MNKVWTKEHDDCLREMAGQGASAVRIAGALNRKIQVVRTRARLLGCRLPSISEHRKMLKRSE
jgi:hypothetical protein